MTFEENIKIWVATDNKIKELNEQLKEIREKRANISTDILGYIHENKLDNATIKISDGRLCFKETKQQQPLTYKFILDCLQKCIDNQQQVDLIMTFIKEQRETKQNTEIKRQYTLN